MIKTEWKLEIYQEKVERRINSQRRRILYRTAGFVRTTVARSIKRPGKRKNKKSRRGEPPKNRTGRLKAGVNFGVDEQAGSFVVGVTPNRTKTTKPQGGKTVPQLIDEGGTARVLTDDNRPVAGVYVPHPFVSYEPTLTKAENAFAENIETIGLT